MSRVPLKQKAMELCKLLENLRALKTHTKNVFVWQMSAYFVSFCTKFFNVKKNMKIFSVEGYVKTAQNDKKNT